MTTQVAILRSADGALDSVLFDIEGLLSADLFSNELDGASELLNEGHLRAGGVVADVVIERHLRQVASNHGFKTRKKNTGLWVAITNT